MKGALAGLVVACDFHHKRHESDALELVTELGGESRLGVSKQVTHYVTDQSNINVLRRAAVLGVRCVTLDWLLKCKAAHRLAPVEPFLIDVSDFARAPESLALPESDDDVEISHAGVPRALSARTAAAAAEPLSMPAAQPLPSAASPSRSQRTRSQQQQQPQEPQPPLLKSASATLELAAESVPVVPLVSVSSSTTASLPSVLKSTSKTAKRTASKFKPPSRHASAETIAPPPPDAFAFEAKEPPPPPPPPPKVVPADAIDLRSDNDVEEVIRSPPASKKRAATASAKKPRGRQIFDDDADDGDSDNDVDDKLIAAAKQSSAKKPRGRQVVHDDDDDDDDDDEKSSSTAGKKRAATTPKPSAKKARGRPKEEADEAISSNDSAPPPPPPPPVATSASKKTKTYASKKSSAAAATPPRASQSAALPTTTAVVAAAAPGFLQASSVSIVFTGGIKGNEANKRAEAKAKQLGIRVDDDVTTHTTHVVLLSDLRTMKVLTGIAQRLWLVEARWLEDADVKRGVPLSENYEVTSFPGAQRARLGGAAPLAELSIFVSGSDTLPAPADLKKLIKLAGGKVATSISKASVVIAAKNSTVWHRDGATVPVVRVPWLLNSVSNWFLDPYEPHWAREFDASETN